MLNTQTQAAFLYNAARKWFTISACFVGPICLKINAPFGRFALASDSLFLVDGIKSWILMELVSPLAFLYAFKSSPLSFYTPALPSITSPQSILAALYLIHYTNRALLSPLRTPSRSKSHIIVPLFAVSFNIVNGLLMGAYLSSPFARIFLSGYTFHRPSFYVGLVLWALGFAGNIMHDEILLDIRRKAKSGGKDRDDDDGGGAAEGKKPTRVAEHYAIPHGLLYRYISYPNYFCEWVEWLGFALAAAPFPITAPLSTLTSLFSIKALSSLFSDPAYLFAPNLSPPYIFLICEVLSMFPRAWNGHLWYKRTFGEKYPRERRAVVPFVI